MTPAPPGAGIRVAIVDSGIAAGHPHVGEVADGVWITAEGTSPDFADRIGHGTAVAGAVREWAPGATLVAVRICDRRLSTTASVLAQAISCGKRISGMLIMFRRFYQQISFIRVPNG